MTRHRITASAIAGALVVSAMLLTACTPSAPNPTEKPSASATPTAEPTEAPTQVPVAAPKDEAQAVSDANKTYKAFLQEQFAFMADPDRGPEFLENYVWPGTRMATLIQDTYENKIENGSSVTGEPIAWQANEAMSYVAPLTNQTTGEVDPLGAVNLFGCSDNTGTTFLVDEVEDTEIPKGAFPSQAVLMYSPEHQGWFVSDQISLTGKEGAPLC